MGNDKFEEIYIMYYKELYLYAFSFCKNHYMAEEFVSDTFFKALISLDESKESVKYWLLFVCRNLIIDYYRKNRKISTREMEEDKLVSSEDTLNKIIKNYEKKILYKVIVNLQDSYKEVIVMYYFMNLSIDEISKILKISKGAIKNLLYRGRRKIAKVLREENNEIQRDI